MGLLPGTQNRKVEERGHHRSIFTHLRWEIKVKEKFGVPWKPKKGTKIKTGARRKGSVGKDGSTRGGGHTWGYYQAQVHEKTRTIMREGVTKSTQEKKIGRGTVEGGKIKEGYEQRGGEGKNWKETENRGHTPS